MRYQQGILNTMTPFTVHEHFAACYLTLNNIVSSYATGAQTFASAFDSPPPVISWTCRLK